MIGNSLKVFLILSSICLVSCSLEGEGIELNNPEICVFNNMYKFTNVKKLTRIA